MHHVIINIAGPVFAHVAISQCRHYCNKEFMPVTLGVKVMEHESICKEFLEMLFGSKIEKITYLSSQNIVAAESGAKTIWGCQKTESLSAFSVRKSHLSKIK